MRNKNARLFAIPAALMIVSRMFYYLDILPELSEFASGMACGLGIVIAIKVLLNKKCEN